MENIVEELRRFLSDSGYLDDNSSISNDESLFDSGVIDSLAVMEITEFMGTNYNFRIPPEDLIPENFDTLSYMANYISKSISDG